MRAAIEVDSSRWAWLRAPCSLTQVCAVIDGTTPPAIARALCERFGTAPQCCVLELHDVAQLHADWLASFSKPGADFKRAHADADRLLAPLPPGCLLALCSAHVEQLDWLGSVTGHPCRLVALDAGTSVETALEAVGAVWMEVLATQLSGER
ncbi:MULTISPECIES: hypothetical protein [unclassified Paraburkholderia]|uniref:hypothetical protein n=1 Tax=unclassified Paraburkholderia TaxID=2615204 RepID=UPI002AB1D33D|nr:MULTISPECIES: hypothetical protein [unclassified Paraburkholderia]